MFIHYKNIDEKELSVWAMRSKEQIENIINHETFPCIFARKACKAKTINWLFCRLSNNQKDDFLNGLIEYTDFIKFTPPKDRLLSPMIAVLEHNANNLEHEHKVAWEFIQYLIDNDSKEWPKEISKSPNDSNWCLCFNEVQLFINVSSSRHLKYKSRNLGENICLVINPREVFDIVAPLNKKKGVKIRERIRERVEVMNGAPAPKELGFFGDKNNLEWRQYQLTEEGGYYPSTCPLTILQRDKQK